MKSFEHEKDDDSSFAVEMIERLYQILKVSQVSSTNTKTAEHFQQTEKSNEDSTEIHALILTDITDVGI